MNRTRVRRARRAVNLGVRAPVRRALVRCDGVALRDDFQHDDGAKNARFDAASCSSETDVVPIVASSSDREHNLLKIFSNSTHSRRQDLFLAEITSEVIDDRGECQAQGMCIALERETSE
eukprot:6212674-Pleurochrysis_carterae.AAC.1